MASTFGEGFDEMEPCTMVKVLIAMFEPIRDAWLAVVETVERALGRRSSDTYPDN
jgi:hypothetical protein